MNASSSPNEEFKDPLENYDPPKYSDPLEKALIEESVAAIQATPFTTIAPDTPIRDAINNMVTQEIACLMVEQDGKLVGVFSDRDLLKHVATDYENMKDRPVSDAMTVRPVFVRQDDSSALALNVVAVSGYRHVPVLDVNDKIVGIISPQRISAFLQSNLK